MLEIVNSPEFRDLPPSQIVPRLADRGVYVCSEPTMYRVLQEEKQLKHRSRSKEPVDRQPVQRVATRPRQLWSWDITFLRTRIAGAFFHLYMIIDVYSRKVVAWAVHEEESSEHAAALIYQAARAEGIDVSELMLHSDNGAPMKGATMLATLRKLGIAASFTRPRVSDDNPFSEALFRTLKYRPGYPEGPFTSLEAARRWVAAFVRWYNHEHLHSGIAFITPGDRHEGRDEAILESRKAVYAEAKAKHPNRWGSRPTRNWEAPKRVVVRARRNPAEEVSSAA